MAFVKLYVPGRLPRVPERAGLAFKAYEIEELADVYFFRPAGIVFARAARALRLTPTAVTIVSVVVGVIGAALLYFDDLAMAGFALIILYSVLDSSDGQLARRPASRQRSVVRSWSGGYVVNRDFRRAGGATLALSAGVSIVGWVFGGLAAAVHAQMYDYHRNVYVRVVIDGKARRAEPGALLRAYDWMQTRLAGSHHDVELMIADRGAGGVVRDSDRVCYRACFYWPVRGWNLMGDNTRFYAIGVLAWLHHLEWFIAFLLIPMNAALVAMWWWQSKADRRFVACLAEADRQPAGL